MLAEAVLVFIPSLTWYVMVSVEPEVGAKYNKYDPSSLTVAESVADLPLPLTSTIVKTPV